MNIDHNLNNLILSYARDENEYLEKNFQMGIFDMPELALAYLIGQEFIKDNPSLTWQRESTIPGYSGIADLIIDKTLIEFKLRDKGDKYKRDVIRMHELESDMVDQKVFILLCDVFNEEDSRFKAVEDTGFVSHIGSAIPSFPTEQSWYKSKQVYCKVGIWQVH